MTNNRRDFLKYSGMATAGIFGPSLKNIPDVLQPWHNQPPPDRKQLFNMSGYAAPRLEKIRIGFIGLGNRGSEAVPRIINIDGVDVRALCDTRDQQVKLTNESLKGTDHHPVFYSGSDNEWKKLCERDDIDLVYICTPWKWHTPMAVYAMQHGKHVAVEVPAAQTLEECWQLVETSEKTRKHCIMLENECFDFFELQTLNMARQGFFGELVHGEGAYIHDIGATLFDRVQRPGSWRLKENAHRQGNLYPTHGLGPVCQVMNINRGDKMEFLTSVGSNDFTLNDIAKALAAKDPSYAEYVDRPFNGNMNSVTIRTNKGRTMLIQHDISSPRPKSSRYLISGTKGTAQYDAGPAKISVSHEGWLPDDKFRELEEQYTLPFVRQVGAKAREVAGKEGMDFLMDWRLMACLRNGIPLDFDVYDAALWSSIVPLSEWSVANASKPVNVPDFTCGSWKTNAPVMLSMEKIKA